MSDNKCYSSLDSPNHNIQQKNHSISIDEAIERLGYGRFQVQVMIAAGLGFAADAMEVLLLSFLSVVLKTLWSLSPEQSAFMTGIVFLGAMTGTLILGRLGDVFGRRLLFLVSAFIIAIFGLLTAICNSYTSLVLVRFLVGFGVGGVTIPFDILAEFLPIRHRGRDLLFIEYFWTIGSIIVPLFAMITIGNKSDGNTNAWRHFVLLSAIPCILSTILGVFLVPESPRWLLTKGRGEEALDILRKAAKTNGLHPYSVFPEDIMLEPEEPETVGMSNLFTKSWRWTTVNLWITWAGLALLYYGIVIATTVLFSDTANFEAGDSYNFDYVAIFTSSLAEVFGTTLAILLIDRAGRVLLQAITYFLGGICILLLFVFSTPLSHTSLVALAFLSRLFMMAASCTTWVATAEILTTEIRSTGHSAANAVARIGGFIAPFIVQDNNNHIVTGVILFGISLLTTFAAAELPETKGKTLGIHLNHPLPSGNQKPHSLFLQLTSNSNL